MKFNIPGKTFLVGEYAALLGASALGLATKPYFEITYSDLATEFHPESPAGLYLARNKKKVSATIKDNYLLNQAKGGFGKSTAEYFAAILPDLIKSKKHFSDILRDYRDLHAQKLIKPSGLDLAFQYFGNVCLADPSIQFYQTFDWHFENLDFYIITTGLKIATHEHLQNLDLNSLKNLVPLSNKITQIYAENKEFEFLAHMKNWCEQLEAHNLIHEHSLNLKNKLESFEPIKLAKPCGALGADVILLFFAKAQKQMVYNYLTENQYHVQAHSSDLSEGVNVELEKYWRQNVD